ncbi:MAG: hypothetical protein R2830_17125 [Saprospiraceae bacterium]
MNSKNSYKSTWQQYKDETPFALTVLLIWALLIGVIVVIGNKEYKEDYLVHEQYLVAGEGIISKRVEVKRSRRMAYWKIYYHYKIDNKLYEGYYETYKPDTIEVGKKCMIWYSTKERQFHKANSLSSKVEKSKLLN